jgi:hypothetical protein
MAEPTLWDYLQGAGETAATLGTGALAGVAGPLYGIYKGITSPNYGTYEGGKEADRAAIEMMNQLTYQPRGEVAQGLIQKLGAFMEDAKIPAVVPEAAPLAALGLNKTAMASQAERAGMALEKAIEPAVIKTLEKGGANAQVLRDLTRGSLSFADSVNGVPVIEILFPNRTLSSLTSAEKSALTKFKKALDTPAVMRREKMAQSGSDIILPTEGEVFAPQRGVNPEDLLGKYAVPVMSDWTGAGETVYQVAGVPLARPVKKQGGTQYGSLQQNIDNEIAWASEPGAASSKIANLNQYSELGDTVGISSYLGPASSNFSHHISEGLVGQLPAIRPSKDAYKQLNKTIRNRVEIKKDKDGNSYKVTPYKNFAGVDSQNIYDIMANGQEGQFSAGNIRKTIAEEMGADKFQKLGFPRIRDVNKAMNKPEAYTGGSGAAIFKAKPDSSIVTPSYKHGSYRAGIPTAGLLGGFEDAQGNIVAVPDYLTFRKTFDQLRKQGKTDANIRTSLLKSHKGEQIDEQTVEGLLKYLGRL